jgi:hypothetical protein
VHYDGAKAQSCIVQKNLHHKQSKSAVLVGHSGKNFSFYFKRYNLTIRAVNFFGTFCTSSPNSLEQDPLVKIPKKNFVFVFAS